MCRFAPYAFHRTFWLHTVSPYSVWGISVTDSEGNMGWLGWIYMVQVLILRTNSWKVHEAEYLQVTYSHTDFTMAKLAILTSRYLYLHNLDICNSTTYLSYDQKYCPFNDHTVKKGNRNNSQESFLNDTPSLHALVFTFVTCIYKLAGFVYYRIL